MLIFTLEWEPTTLELELLLELVCWQCLVTVSVQSSMVVMSTTVWQTVLATFLGVAVGILSQVFSGTELQTGYPADLTGS